MIYHTDEHRPCFEDSVVRMPLPGPPPAKRPVIEAKDTVICHQDGGEGNKIAKPKPVGASSK